MRCRLTALRNAFGHSALEEIDFRSGLGDSAYLLYGLTKAAKPEVVVEIGSARGRSTCYIATALKENGLGKLYAVDPHTATSWNDEDSIDSFQSLRSNLKRLGLQRHVEILRQTSVDAARSWSRPIDLLFIDGDHSYEGVRRDWDLFSPFVRTFGCVVFHDTLWDRNRDSKYFRPDLAVPRFVNDLRTQGYPVITFERDFGVSVVQPTRNGVCLFEQT